MGNNTEFQRVKKADVFRYNNDLYMRIRHRKPIAVNLSNGEIKGFSPTDKVIVYSKANISVN